MLIYSIALVLFAVDQWTKYWVQGHFYLGESVPVIPDIFHLTFILNRGAAFGILEGHQWFFLLIVACLYAFCIYERKNINVWPTYARWGIGLLLGGALGNAVDRTFLPGVVDFFDFRIWPIFNIADIGICIGVTLVAIHFWTMKESE